MAFEKIAENLFRNSASGLIYVRKTFRKAGIPDLFESLKTHSIAEAKREAVRRITRHLEYHSPREDVWTVGKVIDEVLETVTPLRRESTQALHRTYLGELKAEWGDTPLDHVSLASWAKWLRGFRARKARKTFADYSKDMNLVMRYAYTQRYVPHLVTLPNPDRERPPAGRVFTPEEITKLYETMNTDSRDQFVLCFECMMRLREALYLTWDRVNLTKGEIELRPQDVKTGSKTGKGRTFRMSPLAWSRLKDRRARMGKVSAYVFPSPHDYTKPVRQNKRAWQAAKKNAGIKGRARWHDLRHTALTRALMESSQEPAQVSEFAGVSLRTLQKVYLHSTAEQTAPVRFAVSVFNNKKCVSDTSGEE